MQLIPVHPDDVPNFREGRRGRISYPIMKMFLESGYPVTKLDRTGMHNSISSLTAGLGGYARKHNLPVRVFTRSGELYLARTDIDDEGNPLGGEFETDMDALEKRKSTSPEPAGDVLPITEATVDAQETNIDE